MKLGKEFIGDMKSDAIELITAVENYFAIHKEAILKKIMSENFSFQEATAIFLAAKEEAIKNVLKRYLELYKSRQNRII